ncbi:MAG: lysine--tRNA ligase [Chloroflexi bacterium]|nr:lysine--tRNA ligase [Chloroflexota bacterium]
MDEREAHVEKVEKLRATGVEPYAYGFERSHTIAEARRLWESRHPSASASVSPSIGSGRTGEAGATEPVHVRLAGRLTGVRRMGKANFGVIEDQDAKIQVYTSMDKTKGFEAWRDLVDRGDIIGVEGDLFVTRTGELTVQVAEFAVLAKTLQTMPEKYHGLRDQEIMRRQRYLHLLSDLDARQWFKKRSQVVTLVRKFLDERGFIEVQTPILQPLYGGAAARPFVTHHNELKRDMYLRIAPELYLKRLVVGGFERVYEIAACFRNEGIDSSHNPEFTMVEVYQAFADYNDMMRLTEDLWRYLAQQVNGSLVLPKRQVDGKEVAVDLGKPWQRLTYLGAIKQYTGLDFSRVEKVEQAREMAAEIGLRSGELAKMTQWEQVAGYIFDERVEEHLVEPTFIIDYPAALCPLTKRHRSDPRLAERFELYMAGMEQGNAYTELTDPAYQRRQFEAQRQQAAGGDAEAHPMDEDYINALEYGLPPTGGLGIGIDRMLILLTGATSIRDVILFPMQRQSQEEKTEGEGTSS